MNDAPSQKIATHPDEVAVLKKIIRGCSKKPTWDFSTPGQVSFADDCKKFETQNGRLTKLTLTHSELSDLSPLAGLTGLERLDLGCCLRIIDLTPLAALPSLKRLDLEGSGLCDKRRADLGPLADKKDLKIYGAQDGDYED
jgi:Leucine-rich repeat (LRR) protein